jgi:hypothetical protein
MKTIIKGYYGSGKTPCEIMVIDRWYCIVGSMNAHCTVDDEYLVDGVDVETLEDFDYFGWSKEINTLEEFEAAIES